jgi:hypothetical protein
MSTPDAIREVLWRQFGAAIDMLENALAACPEELWGDQERNPQYWYMVYHTLFFLDFYLSESAEDFAPPAPFTLSEMDPSGILPDRVYAKAELKVYLEHGRAKCRAVIHGLTPESALAPRRFGSVDGTLVEGLIYSLRHVQHHAAQLNLILRQEVDAAPSWVGKTSVPLSG